MGKILEGPGDLWTDMPIRFSPGDPLYIEDAVSFTWEFGDGSEVSTHAYPVHEYKDPGYYTVNLTTIDKNDQVDTSSLILFIQRDYGDTEVVLKAVERRRWGTFLDPDPNATEQAAVRRGGWVAYMCEFGSNQMIEVGITIIGDRPVDVYLFEYFDFQTYQNNADLDLVPFEEQGSAQNFTGEFGYSFIAPPGSGIYFIVIDNRDRPLGTYTEGPVDYTISIVSRQIEEEEQDWWETICAANWPLIGLVIVPIAMVIVLILLREKRGNEDRRP
jgi:hypothetical protein